MTTFEELNKLPQSFHLIGLRVDLPTCDDCAFIKFCTLANIMPGTRGCHDAQRSEVKQVTSKGPKRTPRRK